MAMRCATTLRTTRAQALIDAAGTNPKLKWYNGTVPATGGTPAGTLLATTSIVGALGTASAGAIDVNETLSQTAASHVSGTPTFVRITTSADAFVADIDIGSGAGNMQFTGTIATNVNIVLNSSTITEGNA